MTLGSTAAQEMASTMPLASKKRTPYDPVGPFTVAPPLASGTTKWARRSALSPMPP